MKTHIYLLVLASVLMLSTGCRFQHPGAKFDPYARRNTSPLEMQKVALTNGLDPSLLRAPQTPFTLGPGDRIEVEVIDDPNS